MNGPNLKLIFADYAKDLYLPKDTPKYRDSFKNVSSSKWAVKELYLFIIKRKDQPPIISIEQFIEMMDGFSQINKEEPMFHIAKAIALDFLDLFNAMS